MRTFLGIMYLQLKETEEKHRLFKFNCSSLDLYFCILWFETIFHQYLTKVLNGLLILYANCIVFYFQMFQNPITQT